VSCEHLTRRVVRYEHDGSVTTLAESINGKRLNSPNDVVAHPDGSYWFTDPPRRSRGEGRPEPRELPTAVYRIDKGGAVAQVIGEDQVPDPNGLAFSPDYKTLYVASTGRGPGDAGPGGKGDLFALDIAEGRASNPRRFSDFMIDGVKCSPDGVRCDVSGQVWCSSNAGRSVGYSGVTVWTPQGKLIGRIRLPEVCANLCFGGPKRNRLFMAASQSI
jgi:gluconolactonase